MCAQYVNKTTHDYIINWQFQMVHNSTAYLFIGKLFCVLPRHHHWRQDDELDHYALL